MGSKNVIIAVMLVALIVVVWVYRPRARLAEVRLADRRWRVVDDFQNKREAAQLLSDVNSTMIEFFRVLKKKYHVDEPDDVLEHDSVEHARAVRMRNHPGDVYNIIDNLLDNYNPDVFYENDPRGTKETSYTIAKGESMHVCLRNKADPTKLVDRDTLLFVMLHEASHIANYRGWGHDTQFWETFRFILHEAVLAGIYKPVDYAKHPVEYCGLRIAYEPLYDPSLRNIWEL